MIGYFKVLKLGNDIQRVKNGITVTKRLLTYKTSYMYRTDIVEGNTLCYIY